MMSAWDRIMRKEDKALDDYQRAVCMRERADAWYGPIGRIRARLRVWTTRRAYRAATEDADALRFRHERDL